MAERNQAVLDFLLSRRSTPAKVMHAPDISEADLNTILRAAARVADHGQLVPWRFVTIEGAAFARLSQLAKARAIELGKDEETISKAHGQFDRGHLAVAVIVSPKPSDKIPQIEQVLSAGAACQSLVNAALASGFAAQWITGWISHDKTFATQAFALAEDEFIAGIIYLGSSTSATPERPRPDLSAITSKASG